MTHSFEHLLDTLYASLLEEPPWLTFLDAMERQLPCHHCTMVLRRPRDGDAGVLIASSINNPAIAALQREHYRDSPFLDLPEGKICVLTENELKTRHTAYYQYIRHFSLVTDVIGVNMIEPRTGMVFRLRAARIDGEPGFGKRERKIFESLVPRLRIAIALYAHNALQEYRLSILDETASQVAIGAAVIDASRRILIKNMVLDRVLHERDGFHASDGVLHCNYTKDDRKLRMLMSRFSPDAPQPQEDQIMKVRRAAGNDHSWSILMRPSLRRLGVHELGVHEKAQPTVIVLLRDANHTPNVTVSKLIELLGLTHAEAALAVQLVKGQSLADAAATLNISRFTARNQLISIFDRTGVRRQALLVGHILKMMKNIWE